MIDWQDYRTLTVLFGLGLVAFILSQAVWVFVRSRRDKWERIAREDSTPIDENDEEEV